MKVIFLDIDGVLNVYNNTKDRFGFTFHKPFEDNLRWIIEETGAKIVISSTWKIDGIEYLKDMWYERGLPGDIIGITPNEVDVVEKGTCDFYDQVDRGYEIQQWLDEHSVDSFCIIDDIDDMLPLHKNNFVKTSNNNDHIDSIGNGYGLTKKCSEKIIEILNRTL